MCERTQRRRSVGVGRGQAMRQVEGSRRESDDTLHMCDSPPFNRAIVQADRGFNFVRPILRLACRARARSVAGIARGCHSMRVLMRDVVCRGVLGVFAQAHE